MNARVKKLQSLCQHPWYSKLCKKIDENEFDLIVEFCEDNSDLNALEFEYAANRLFIDKEKTKHFAIVNELLVVLSTAQ